MVPYERMTAIEIGDGWDDGRKGFNYCRLDAMLDPEFGLRAELTWVDDSGQFHSPLLLIETNAHRDGSLVRQEYCVIQLTDEEAVMTMRSAAAIVLHKYANIVGLLKRVYPTSCKRAVYDDGQVLVCSKCSNFTHFTGRQTPSGTAPVDVDHLGRSAEYVIDDDRIIIDSLNWSEPHGPFTCRECGEPAVWRSPAARPASDGPYEFRQNLRVKCRECSAVGSFGDDLLTRGSSEEIKAGLLSMLRSAGWEDGEAGPLCPSCGRKPGW